MYPVTSPYRNTDVVGNQFLDVMANVPIPRYPTDVYWQITAGYNFRPDLLAYDLYSDSRLWWVFAQRNPNVLKDPLFDFKTGMYIFIPTIEVIKEALGT